MIAPYTSEDQLSVGDIVDQRYRIVRVLGEGGMGAVYEAEQTTLGKRVALKVLKREHVGREKAVKRFLREARALSAIDHANVVQIMNYGELPGGAVYYVMEYLEGQDLARLIRQAGPLPWSRARGIFLQAARALQAAHDAGIVHRDVKPANCLVDTTETGADLVKVLDFGIAKNPTSDTNALTGTSELLGTVRYMSPEQANGLAADARSDQYSLGILMYEVLAGSVPFDGPNAFHVLYRHTMEPPRPLRELAPDVPAPVESIVLRALAKKAEDRYGSMRELAAELESIDTAGNAAPPPSPLRTGATIPAGSLDIQDLPFAVRAPGTSPSDVGVAPAARPKTGPPLAASPAPIPRGPSVIIAVVAASAIAVGAAVALALKLLG